jgi:hypothetical protein
MNILIFIFRQQTGIEKFVDRWIAGLRLQRTNSSTSWESKMFRPHPILSLYYTGRFIMFFVITNIYNKKTKGPTLMELFTATVKLKKLSFTTRDVRCINHGWHDTHRYDIQVLATHASTWVHRYRIDVCRVTRGAHIEHLQLSKKVFSFPVAVKNSIKVGLLVFLL